MQPGELAWESIKKMIEVFSKDTLGNGQIYPFAVVLKYKYFEERDMNWKFFRLEFKSTKYNIEFYSKEFKFYSKQNIPFFLELEFLAPIWSAENYHIYVKEEGNTTRCKSF